MVTPIVKVYDVVQIKPEYDEVFGGCLLVVTEVRGWGVQGYVNIPGPSQNGQAYFRCRYDGLETTGGSAPYVVDYALDEVEEPPLDKYLTIPDKAENDNDRSS